MKHVFLLSSLLLAGGTILSSCSSDELFSSRENLKRIEASICNFQMEDSIDATRTLYTLGNNGYEAVWATGDVLGIYPLGGDQVAFPISDGIGTTRAVFDGGAWALRGTYKYAAYYPFSQDNYTNSEAAIPVTYLGQTQSSNNATAHLANYDYMAAAATQPSSDGSVTLPFKHLGSYLILPLTLPKAGTYTQLTLTSDKGEFITKGTVDLSAASPAITATETSSSISMNLDNIVLTSGNLVLTVNMLIAPVNLTGSTITIAVKDSDGAIYTNKEKAWTRSAAFLANTTYKASRTLAGSGTGGEIEGGGGLEEDDEEPNMHNGHEYVDLGLPSGLKWATCNVGATAPEEYGDYYAWGETTPKTVYKWNTYKWCNGSYSTLTKYCTSLSYGVVDNKTVLDPDDDAAHINWGGNWRMPTRAEQEELEKNCSYCMVSLGGKICFKVVGPNGNFIYLTASGALLEDGLRAEGYGYFWSSSLDTRSNSLTYQAYGSAIGEDFFDWGSSDRYFGKPVRPVFSEGSLSNSDPIPDETDPFNGHEYVDLGLKDSEGRTIYWATCNVGAENPEDTGLYFAWGATEGYGTNTNDGHPFNWANTPFNNGSTDFNSTYFNSVKNSVCSDGTLALEYDAARQKWEGLWRMPTSSEFDLLIDNCTWTWDNSKGCYKVSNKQDSNKYILLPASDRRLNSIIYGPSSSYRGGYYWSSSLFDTSPRDAYSLDFSYQRISLNTYDRIYGHNIRPVCVLSE